MFYIDVKQNIRVHAKNGKPDQYLINESARPRIPAQTTILYRVFNLYTSIIYSTKTLHLTNSDICLKHTLA